MAILTRMKKREYAGFKDFVRSLETTGSNRRRDILQLALLEDPIYTSWIMKNIMSLKDITGLNSDELEAIIQAVPNKVMTFAKAVYKIPDIEFIKNEVLPKSLLSQFKEEYDLIKDLKAGDQEAARYLLYKTARDLQEKELITGLTWLFPDPNIIKEEKNKSFSGEVKLTFDNGVLAAQGEMVKGQRHGMWKHFYDNGKLVAEGGYEAGEKVGMWKFFASTGQIKAEGEFKHDTKEGEWKEYDKDGKMTVILYQDGRPAKEK